MTSTSRAPWMGSPITSSVALTSRLSSPQRDRPASNGQHEMDGDPCAEQQTTLDQTGEAVESQRSRDIVGHYARGAIPEPRVGDETLGIAARSRERHIERPSHRAL